MRTDPGCAVATGPRAIIRVAAHCEREAVRTDPAAGSEPGREEADCTTVR